MIIALDGTPLTEPTGGVARYTWELAHNLAETFPGDQYWLLSDQTFAMPLDRPLNLHSGARPTSTIDRRWWFWGLRHEMERRGADLFHGTDFAVPYVPSKPSVMTVHDLSPWIDAPWNHASARVKWRTPQMLKMGLAKMVITPTEAIRAAVLQRFELAPDQVVAVPLAARPMFHPVEADTDIPYFLFVGTLEGRKNVRGLVDAWRELYARHGVELWLVGRVRHDFDPPAETPGLRYLGSVDDSELPELYSGAVAFVYPSHYEGFGLPILEAMACGRAVACSNTTAMPEVAGSSALLFDPADAEQMAHAISKILTNDDLRRRLESEGVQHASTFSWERAAAKTLNVYYEVVGATRRVDVAVKAGVA